MKQRPDREAAAPAIGGNHGTTLRPQQRRSGRQRARVRRVLLAVAVLVGVAGAAAAFWARAQLHASLPILDGSLRLSGLSAPVTITRDARGVPTIRGASRADVARATGFLHAQERFFQMDLARRRAAGELGELAGARAIPLDREIRIHRFRPEAQRAVSLLSRRDRAVLEAYTAGVNAGLARLGAPPFEYLVLRQSPAPWRDEDSFLVVLSMFATLQDTDGAYEATLATMRDVLPAPMFDFLAPPGTEWDAPVVGEAFPMPPIPGPEVYDLRTRRSGKRPIDLPVLDQDASLWSPHRAGGDAALGSNSWALSGTVTLDGRPLLANDMHLPIRVPNTWYHAVLEWPDPADAARPHTLVGVTLPGVPALVVGSNTHVAWGLTNTYADWSDIVLLDVDPGRPSRYRTPHGWREFEQYDEVLKVAGGGEQRQSVSWTIWGPVIEPDHRGRPRAYRWVAHDADRLALSLVPLEEARTVDEAFDAVNGLGAPGQNFVVADRSGGIGWTIYGSIPRRAGLDGQLPVSWADGAAGWSGWIARVEYPRIVDPPSGRIWTANARVVDGGMLARLGDGGYEVGSRATIIRDRLMVAERLAPEDSLSLQLDTSAVFMARWRELILRTLTSDAIRSNSARAAFRSIVQRDWSGQASPDSVAYRLTRSFRDEVSRRVIRFVLAECYEADAAFDYTTIRRREGPIWKLVDERPPHLLDPQHTSWDELLLSAVDKVIDEAQGIWRGGLREQVWSELNITEYRHPLSSSLPFASRWLDMPARPLPGDLFTPRMHWGSAGASQRMIVSPGREHEGIMQLPAGQSGHPLSPFYRSSHVAWLDGEPAPLMPGPAAHTLRLVP